MEFVEAVQLVYNLANGMELTADEETPRELLRQAECQSEALNLICEWLHAHQAC
jgi:prophage maintenance system killer protein